MKEQLQLLVKLQKTESRVTELRNRKAELPRLRAALESELADRDSDLQALRDRLETLRVEHRSKEAKLADGAERVKKAKNRLLEVKTNKEYEATLKEIDSINDANGFIEEEIISLLDEIDRTAGSVAEAEAALEEHRRLFEQKTAGIDEELDSIDRLLQDVEKDKQALRVQISSAVIRKFDLIRGRRNGQAVVSVRREVCDGCHMNIPPQMYNDLMRGEELMLCPHCNRIIYFEEESSENQA